jgi:hypothetical protein
MEDTDIHAKAAADHQWSLMRASFDGDWKGITTWYGRNSHGMNLKQGTVNPEASLYAIRFSDAHTGEWHGTGLRFAPGGEPLSRHNYNLGHTCWHFPQTAGQSSLQMAGNSGLAGHEVNFFSRRSRSMLVALYQQQPDGQMRLDSIAATPFRCQRTSPDSERAGFESLEAVFETVLGWQGMESMIRPGYASRIAVSDQHLTPFCGELFMKNEVNGLFADNLICSLPDSLPTHSYDLCFGCKVDPQNFVHLTIEFDADHNLLSWIERRYQPTMHG